MAKHIRVLGPYEDKDKWRIIVIDEQGRRISHMADGSHAAQRLVLQLKAKIAAPTAQLLDEWCAAKRASGKCAEQTVVGQRHQVQQLLGRYLGARCYKYGALFPAG